MAIAGSILAVAALFSPLGRRVQRWVERRFNRGRYSVEQVMASFTESLQDRVDQKRTGDEWGGLVSETNPSRSGFG